MIIYSEYVLAKYIFAAKKTSDKNCKNPVHGNCKEDFLECSLLGIGHPEHYNYIIDAFIVPQVCSATLTELDDGAVNDFFADYCAGDKTVHGDIPVVSPGQVLKVWMHTHPGSSSTPSGTDNETFGKFFVKHPFCAMQILAKDNLSHYSRVKYQTMFNTTKISEEETFVEIPKLGNKKVTIGDWLSIAKDLEIVKEKIKFNEFPEYNFSLFEDYSIYHEKWLEEIKNNVSRKEYATQYHHYQHYGSTPGYKIPVSYHTSKKNGILTREDLVEFLIDNDIKSKNALNKEMKKAKRILSSTQSEILSTFDEIVQSENSFSEKELRDCLEYNQVTSINEIDSHKLKDMCVWLVTRPNVLQVKLKQFFMRA